MSKRDKETGPIVFGQVTARQAEDLYRFGTVTSILLPDLPEADFDMPGYPPSERARLNEIANRWRRAYCGNFLRVVGDYTGDNWLIYESYDTGADQRAHITTDHVPTSEMVDYADIDAFVCNAPEDVKWLLQTLLDVLNPEQDDPTEDGDPGDENDTWDDLQDLRAAR